MTTLARLRWTRRRYALGTLVVGLLAEACAYVALTVARLLAFEGAVELAPAYLPGLLYAVVGFAWLTLAALLWPLAGNLPLALASQDEIGCDVLIAGATEQKRRLREQDEYLARRREIRLVTEGSRAAQRMRERRGA